MKTKMFFAALLLSGGAAYAQTPPTSAPAVPPASTPKPVVPPAESPIVAPQNSQRATIDHSTPPAPTATQERVRNRQTVMDGQPSPGVEATAGRGLRRPATKKPRPARNPRPTGDQ